MGAGYRARLTAPLIRGDDIVGLLAVRRRTPGSFPQDTVDLMKTFAAQSAVAIQNARLFESVETRTRELVKSLQDLRTAQDRLIQTEKLASLGQLTAGIAHEIKNPLNFVNSFSAVSIELIDELRERRAAPLPSTRDLRHGSGCDHGTQGYPPQRRRPQCRYDIGRARGGAKRRSEPRRDQGVCRGLSHIWCDRVPQVGLETGWVGPATYE